MNEELDSERNNTSLKQYYSNLMDQLEIDGIPKEKISSIGSNLVKQKKANALNLPIEEVSIGSWWFDIAKEKGCTDPRFSPSGVTEPEPENSSINTKNAEAIDILLYTKSICDLAIKKFKEYPEMESVFGKKEAREFFRQWRTIITNCKYAFDEKTKVPQNTEQILLECLTTSSGSLSEGAGEFMQIRIKLLLNQRKSILTAKQGKKFQMGDKASQLPLLKPLTRDTAVFLDYFGVQCECSSWRIRHKPDTTNVECYDCDKEFPAKTISKCRYCQMPLYKENLKHIADTKKCNNCNTEIILPQELIAYANS